MGTLDSTKNSFMLPPVPPSLLSPPILSPADISGENYEALGRYYGIYNVPFPPAPYKIVTGNLSGEEHRLSTELAIPDGYWPETFNASCNLPTVTSPITGTLIAGEKQTPISPSSTLISISDPLQLLVSPPVTIAADHIVLPVLLEISALTSPMLPEIYMSLDVLCKRSDELFYHWQQQVFILLLQGYEAGIKPAP